MRPVVVHISADYPDAWQPQKTRAIAELVEGTRDRFDHLVYSINRTGSSLSAILAPGAVSAVGVNDGVVTWRYAAGPRGLFLARSMRRVGRAVASDLQARGIQPALVVGHKLGFEAIAAREAARMLAVPFAVTLQGNTDQKVLSARRDLLPLYRKIWREAAAVTAFAPWIARWCAARLGPVAAEVTVLPCVPIADAVIPPSPAGSRVVTAFHLDDWRNKNIAGLIAACALLRNKLPDLSLEIAGGGSHASEAAIDDIIARAAAEGFVRRIGALPADAIQEWMNRAAVFVMPSLRESFGMVFVESLLAGCPVVYPRGAAVDGYFDGCDFALGVDARSPRSIADAMGSILRENSKRKAALRNWQDAGEAEPFRRPAITAGFAEILEAAIRRAAT